MSLRVALVNPATRSGTPVIRTGRCQVRCLPGIGLWPPIGLAQVASAVRSAPGAGGVWLKDGALDGDFEAVGREIAAYAPDVVVVDSTTPTLADDLELARRVKERLPGALVAFYGTHATARPEDVVGREAGGAVDCAIIGEPEAAAAEICAARARGDGLEGVAGLALRAPGAGARRTAPREPVADLDSLGPPARDLLSNRRYRLSFNGKPFTIIQPSRGCPYRCKFCTAPLFSGRPRFRSGASVAAEAAEVVERYGIRDFMFLSDTFTASRSRVRELCQELIARPGRIRWVANSRTDTIDPDTARLMRRAGCWLVSLGVESGSDAVLAAADKGATVADSHRAVDVFRRAGIRTIGYFMFGLSGETPQTVRETIALARQLPLDYAYFYVATPFPGTALFEEAQRNGTLVSTDWRRYFHGESDVLEYEGLSAADLSRAVREGYRAFYLRPARVLGYLGQARSPGALLRHARAFAEVLGRAFWPRRRPAGAAAAREGAE